jgi:hypothetical protein
MDIMLHVFEEEDMTEFIQNGIKRIGDGIIDEDTDGDEQPGANKLPDPPV